MKVSKKYHCQIVQDGKTWGAEIIRRVTARVSVVSKRQDGFATEAEAQAWGQKEVAVFLKSTNVKESDKRRASKK